MSFLIERKRVFSTNLNGSDSAKIEELKKLVVQNEAYLICVQEYKSAKITLETLAAFPLEKWLYLFTPFVMGASQGLLTIVKKTSTISINAVDMSEIGLLMHRVDFATESESFSLGNFYLAPSVELTPARCEKFWSFVQLTMKSYGDFNVNTGNRGQILEGFLSEHEDWVQLVDFPTFRPHNSQTRAGNLTDIVLSRIDWEHQIQDSGIFLADHTLILDSLFIKIKSEKEKTLPKSHFYYDETKVTNELKAKLWREMPKFPNMSDIDWLTRSFLREIRTRKKPKDAAIQLEFLPDSGETSQSSHSAADLSIDPHHGVETGPRLNHLSAPDISIDSVHGVETGPRYNQRADSLSNFWENVCSEISGLFDIGACFKVINCFAKGEELSASRVSTFSRSQNDKSFRKFFDRIQKKKMLTKDEDLRYRRILRKTSSRFRSQRPKFRFSPHSVALELQKMNAKAAAGPDGFLSSFFPDTNDKSGIEKLCNFINDIVFKNESGIYLPNRLKNARLTFIPKSDNTAETRPLCLNSRLLALADRLINRKILNLMDLDPSLDNRHAFRDDRGVEDAIAEIVHFVEQAKLANEKVLICQADLSNAFNGCNHQLVILRVYDLLVKNGKHTDGEFSWIILYIKSWLERGITFEGTWFSLINGVPQGSPLSPSIFTLVFAWQYSSTGVSIVLYADDISMLLRAANWGILSAMLNHILRDFSGWCDRNDFKINIDKSKILVFSESNAVLEVDEDFADLEQVTVLRILGVRFDSKFNFSWHVLMVEKYMKIRAVALRRLRSLGLSDKCLKAAALCLRAKITFGLFHLMTLNKTRFEKLEQIWVQVVRAWSSATQFVPNTEVLDKSGTCTIKKFVIYLLMTRYRKNLQILPKGCFEVPDEAAVTGLPNSPVEKLHNLRSSTLEKSEISRQLVQEREIEKTKKSSKKFLESIELGMKVTFTELKASSPPHLLKGRLKRSFEITRKVDANKRNEIFEKYKSEKIEKFGLFKYGT